MNRNTIDLVKSAMKLDSTIRPAQRACILKFLVTLDPSAASPTAVAIPDKFLTPKEAAQYLRLSKRTLARYVKAGQIKPSRLNARVLRFKKTELDAFIASDGVPATQDTTMLRPTG